jgi:hypothetical protein
VKPLEIEKIFPIRVYTRDYYFNGIKSYCNERIMHKSVRSNVAIILNTILMFVPPVYIQDLNEVINTIVIREHQMFRTHYLDVLFRLR